MQCLSSISNYIPSVFIPSKDDSCKTRILQIALPIFAMLAGFLLLPSKAAIIFTVAVIVGVFVCCTKRPDSPPSDDSSLPPLEDCDAEDLEEDPMPEDLQKIALGEAIDIIIEEQQQRALLDDKEVIVVSRNGNPSSTSQMKDPIIAQFEEAYGSNQGSNPAVFPHRTSGSSDCPVQ